MAFAPDFYKRHGKKSHRHTTAAYICRCGSCAGHLGDDPSHPHSIQAVWEVG